MNIDDEQYKSSEILDSLIAYNIMDSFEDSLNNIIELSNILYFITQEEIDMIDTCFKKYISFKRKQLHNLEHMLYAVQNAEFILQKESNSYFFNQNTSINISNETKDIIKNTINNNNQENDDIFLLKDSKILILNKLIFDLKDELLILYFKVIKICRNFLNILKINDFNESKLFFLKTIADHKRYIYEITHNKNDLFEIGIIYGEAISEANIIKQKNQCDLNYFKFYLNYVVYLHDILLEKIKAINLAKQILEEALFSFDKIKLINETEIILICQLFKDNISLWNKN